MEISVLASGSNGNSCLVEDKGVSLLIDAGKSGKQLRYRMDRLGKNLEEVDAILLTHSHQDHVCGAGVLARRFGIPVYLTKDVDFEINMGECEKRYFQVNRKFKVKGLEVQPVMTSHAVPSCGFVVGNFGLFTDTGIVTEQMKTVFPKLKGVLLESNHDVDMVLEGPYPFHLKQWVLSDHGHLSNIHASSLVEGLGKRLDFVLLGHMSGNNNSVHSVRKTFEQLVNRKVEYSVCSREKASGNWEIR